ncbi:MAG: hypothetical protein EZS28_051099, partial [Streblomastix strix]
MQSFEYYSFVQRSVKSLIVTKQFAAIAIPVLQVFGDLICKLFPAPEAEHSQNERSDNKKFVEERLVAGIVVKMQIVPPQPQQFEYPGSVQQFVNDDSITEIRLLLFYYTIAIAPPDPGQLHELPINVTQFKLKIPQSIQAKILPPSEFALLHDSNYVFSISTDELAQSCVSKQRIAPPGPD